RHLRLRARVVSARFDAAGDAWEVTTEGGATLRASIVVSGCGGLSRPALPDIPGRARFAGAAFHSARWDHDYPLAGKAVAVIGTGASAIQFVPAIAPQVARLSLFQRTPAWVLPRRDHEISATTRRRYARAPLTRWLRRQAIYWRNEGVAIPMTLAPKILELAARLGVAHLRRQIADPRLRAALTPDYTMGCKRVLLSDDYYPALARDNVTLVTAGIERIDETGVITRDGAHHPVDAILYGTGFQAAEDVAPFPIFGRDGQELADVWRAGAEAYYGTAVAGFPNLFLIVGPNTGLGHSSMVLMIESQIAFILRCLERMDRARLTRLEVREDAQRRFNAGIHRRLSRTVWASGCASWYQTSTGKNTTLWPGFTWEFRLRTRRPRFSDFEARPA
ncbi:MAG: NAD(P)/FAD-dependent oxidoreductase, partial [Myxococcales bacterium]|nr:NAD(P)/FAD-dependent oxidoreductase [Myxococcales bacterium]